MHLPPPPSIPLSLLYILVRSSTVQYVPWLTELLSPPFSLFFPGSINNDSDQENVGVTENLSPRPLGESEIDGKGTSGNLENVSRKRGSRDRKTKQKKELESSGESEGRVSRASGERRSRVIK